MKKRKKPIRKMPLEIYEGSLVITEDYPRLDYREMRGLKLENTEDYRIIIDACLLDKVIINHNKFAKTEFIDCTFTNCDLSNNTFTDSIFLRCEFIGCKFIGTHFVQSHITNVLFENCNLEYLDMAENKIKLFEINRSSLKESNWFENVVDGVVFDENNLSKTTFYNNPMKGLDVSNCILDEIKMDRVSVAGISIDRYQAQIFCHLLGIKVKE